MTCYMLKQNWLVLYKKNTKSDDRVRIIFLEDIYVRSLRIIYTAAFNRLFKIYLFMAEYDFTCLTRGGVLSRNKQYILLTLFWNCIITPFVNLLKFNLLC